MDGWIQRGSRRRRVGGFTFVEILAALMFLALVIPAIVTALSLSGRAGELTERGEAAAQLAENKLNEMLVGDAWQTASGGSGDFGPDWPDYRWQLTQTPWTTDSASAMTELKVEVSFKVQGVEHSATLSTLVNTLTSTTSTNSTSATGTGTGGTTR